MRLLRRDFISQVFPDVKTGKVYWGYLWNLLQNYSLGNYENA